MAQRLSALLDLDLHLLGEFATERIVRFLRHMAALQLLGMGRPRAWPEGPREAGIGQRRGCRDRFGHLHPAQGRTFLRKALLRPERSHHSASLRLALHPKNRTLHPVQLPDLG